MREGLELSQTALAAGLARPQSCVSRLESGDRGLDIVELVELGAALDSPAGLVLQQVEYAWEREVEADVA